MLLHVPEYFVYFIVDDEFSPPGSQYITSDPVAHEVYRTVLCKTWSALLPVLGMAVAIFVVAKTRKAREKTKMKIPLITIFSNIGNIII